MHVVNNTASPDDNTLGHARSSLRVLSAADITDVSVILQVQHPDVAALEVRVKGGWGWRWAGQGSREGGVRVWGYRKGQHGALTD